MLLRLLEEDYPLDVVVFYDTRMEFDSIYRIKDRVVPILAQHGIEFVELYPSEPFLYSMLERRVKYRTKNGFHYGYGWCGGSCRWGTTAKLQAIKKYKESLCDDVTDYVGIAADEPQRFCKAKAEGKRLPLVEWEMTEADCLEYCHSRGYFWEERSLYPDTETIDLYDILDRVSCWCCANKNLKELRNIYLYLPHLYLPQYWSKLEDLQVRITRPFKGFYKGQPRGIFELGKIYASEKQKEDEKWE